MSMVKKTAAIIDMHTHILPGVDDGSRSLEESCRMLEHAAEQGVQAVIATPHYSRRQGTDGLQELAELLQEKIRKTLPHFCVYLGQETYYHDDLTERLRSGQALSLAGSRYVLVEFDPMVSYAKLFQGVRRLLQAGYVPVLAHMERYLCLRQGENLEDLAGSGCLFQMNYESLKGSRFNRETGWCRKQVSQGRIQFLGTDMHRLDHRPPDIDGAWRWLERHVAPEVLEAIAHGNPMRLIQDEKIG